MFAGCQRHSVNVLHSDGYPLSGMAWTEVTIAATIGQMTDLVSSADGHSTIDCHVGTGDR